MKAPGEPAPSSALPSTGLRAGAAGRTIRKAIEVSGIVQGVGFRPYVYRLATERGLSGTITNTAAGVAIEIQGPQEAVEDFLVRLPVEAPPLARITAVAVRELACDHDLGFRILESRAGEEHQVLISPDVALCADCFRELFDSTDRRYRYPFINCTNCGPRYTIVRDIPYDRARTSMAIFSMCAACQREYDDPENRRFHAQPNACWECGPRVELWNRNGERIEVGEPFTASVHGKPIAEAAVHLQAGAVVAVKGLGGFHLAVDATNAAAVERLRERKRRVEKPFAVMAADLKLIEQFCEVDEVGHELLQRAERPIVLLPKKRPSPIVEAVAPFNRYLGVFLPYTPLHHLLFAEGGFQALVMTSGNLSEEPIAIDNQEAVKRLGELADFFLVHNRDILLRCDDSVVRPFTARPDGIGASVHFRAGLSAVADEHGEPTGSDPIKVGKPRSQRRSRQLRRSRGYVPVPVFLREELPPILAVGGELKNTICLTKGRHAFLSQHIGDLENLESYRFFEEVVGHMERILEISPRILAYDLHPGYFSTQWALALSGAEGLKPESGKHVGLERVGVQHHHAHIASCMAENHLDGRVIGLALDGTGYGTDGQIWGGEALLADYCDFERVAHFAYVPMPGGAAAIHEPWRMAVSYLAQHFGRAFLDFRIPFVQRLDRRRVEVVLRMLDGRVNSPLTSSCGRLFDAVAALAGIRQRVNYEAQAAIELEMAIDETVDSDGAYPLGLEANPKIENRKPKIGSDSLPEASFEFPDSSFDSIHHLGGRLPRGLGSTVRWLALSEAEGSPGTGHWTIDTRPMFEALVGDLKEGVPPGIISRRFHNGLVELFTRLALLLRKRTGLNRVCLSGGTFQNVYLLEHLTARLQADGFEVFTHAEVPAGDGGLSLGQALVAAHRLR